MALIGCPPPAPESITILNPVDLKAHDINLESGLASIAVAINLTSSSGRALKTGSFQAFVTEDIPGVEPGDVDEYGNLIEQPVDITSYFNVNYWTRYASLKSPLLLPMGWYFLQAKVKDVLNVEASDLVVFSVDYPGPLFLGSTNSPADEMHATVSGIHDECFGGIFNGYFEDALYGFANVPSFLEVKAAEPWGLLVDVMAPPVIVPGGVLTLLVHVVNNAMLFPPTQLAPVDLGPPSGGLLPCEVGAEVMGIVRRTGPESAAPRLVFQNVTLEDSPTGGSCWLPPPPVGCQSVVDLEATAYHSPGN